MTSVIQTFFVFSFAVVAFSQYLRTTSANAVREWRDNSRAIDEQIRSRYGRSHPSFAKFETSKPLNNLRDKLMGPECDIEHRTAWYYLLFAYLMSVLLFAAIEPYFRLLELDKGVLEIFYTRQGPITGAYVFLGVLIDLVVFWVGFKTIKPQKIAKQTHEKLILTYDTLRDSIEKPNPQSAD